MAKLVSTANLLQSTINFQELNLNQYRQLLKCFLGDDIYPKLIFNNIDNIIKELTDINQIQIDNLSFLDYCLLLFNIRQVSIGDTVFLYVETLEQKTLKIDLRISKVIELLFDKNLLKQLQPETIDACTIEYRLPSIKEIMLLEEEKDFYSIYTFFVKSLKFSNTDINLESFLYKEREAIIQKIPVRVMTAITKRTHSLIDICNNFNLLKSVNNDVFNKPLSLSLNSTIIAFVLKLLYNTNLESIYDYMFALSKAANFSCLFLDKCSPGEFYLFTKKLEELSAKQQEATTATNDLNQLPPVDSEFQLE